MLFLWTDLVTVCLVQKHLPVLLDLQLLLGEGRAWEYVENKMINKRLLNQISQKSLPVPFSFQTEHCNTAVVLIIPEQMRFFFFFKFNFNEA